MKILLTCVLTLFLLNAAPSYASEIKVSHKQTIDQILTMFDNTYVYPKTAQKMRKHVEKKWAVGEYSEIESQRSLLKALQQDLREVSKDNHISVHLNSDMAKPKSHVSPHPDENIFNFELITSELAHLTLNKFGGGDKTKQAISEAMNSASNTEAILIDLRENGGGDPDLVAFLSSYFLPKNTLLWSIIDRNGESIMHASTVALAKGQSIYQGTVYILISNKTYSAPEAFADVLQSHGIATVVGEASGGGAHLVQMEPVTDAISVRMPVVRAYNPITKSNWEGHGVIPDIKSKSEDAKLRAIEHFQSQAAFK